MLNAAIRAAARRNALFFFIVVISSLYCSNLLSFLRFLWFLHYSVSVSHAAYTADYIKDAIVLPENASSINVCTSL